MLRNLFNNKDTNGRTNVEELVVAFTILAGVILALIQLVYNRSLCGDEVWLALNIVNRGHLELLKPLGYVQSAPILFLQIEKFFSELIPNTEYGLKLFPLISYFLSMFFFYRIVRMLHKNYFTIVFTLSLFVFNLYLIYYSNEVKQYMSDVLVLTSVYYFLLKPYHDPGKRYLWLGIIGAIGIFLSNVAIIILFAAGLYLLLDSYRNEKKYLANLFGISAVWAVSFVLYFFLFVHNNPVRDKMVGEWAGAFLPPNPFSIEFYKFILVKGSEVLRLLFQFANRGPWFIVLIIAGLVCLTIKRRMDLIILTIVPVLLHLGLSALKLYPIVPRLCLYTTPLFILLCAFGIDPLVNKLSGYFKIQRPGLIAAAIPVLMICYYCVLVHIKGFPIRRSEIRNSIDYLAQNMKKNDLAYVTYHASWCFEYYQKINYVKIAPQNIMIEENYNMNDTADYSKKVDLLRGRVWVLFTVIGDETKTKNFLTHCIQSKGVNPIQEFHTDGSDVYLYDFGNGKP